MAQEPDSRHEWQQTVTYRRSSSTETKPQALPALLRLPPELRLRIYDYATGFDLRQHGRRSTYRASWTCPPLTAQRLRYPSATAMLLSVCRFVRHEVLSEFLRSRIVQFPAWKPEFKLQCLYWINSVTDDFIRALGLFYLKGVYWSYSVHLREKSSRKTSDDAREDLRAARVDRPGQPVTVEGDQYVLRVYCITSMTRRAIAAASEMGILLDEVLRDRDGEEGLGKGEMKRVVRGARLCVGEQLGGSLKCEGGEDDDVEESARSVEMMRTLARCQGCSMHLASNCRRNDIWKNRNEWP